MNSALASPHRLFKQSKSSVLLLESICILTSPGDLTSSKTSSEFPLQGTCSSALELHNATTPNEILDPHTYSHFPLKSDFYGSRRVQKVAHIFYFFDSQPHFTLFAP
ncbi:uncharacterized protein K444DRAFT_64786 [Hyaloscypha bicolor E]|uniref:Uncharacterized protein n=1 Tax=Hyaloscypha bicolor E TaxID=1095630 RepID=A0A2J6T0B8_9HELO|nr:uncharacterized protein K444DRAFT_64786 [Hyaloscypha bicolor E]PMD56457.1 hypothetical protein K444DRAFT_64786 [Hyaloscypha bicolor E]